jgi:hypothetical protein
MTSPTPNSERAATADEFAPFHPQASHVNPDYRDGWNACHLAAQSALTAAESRASAAEADARRYRWLRDVGDATWRPFGLRAALVDAAIDAAINKGASHG